MAVGFAGLDPNRRYQVASDGKTLLYLRSDNKWVPTTLAKEQARMGVAQPAAQAASAAEPPPAGPPVDPYLEAQKAAATRTIQLGDAWDAYQTSQIQSEYGYDPSGNIDTSNPYSRAMHAYKLYQRGTEDINRSAGIAQDRSFIDLAAAGHLNSGARLNAQSYIQGNAQRALTRGSEDYAFTNDALKKQLAAALGGILKGKVDRYSQVGADVNTDKLTSLMKALGS